MYSDEITVTLENLEKLFKEIHLLLKSNINTHVFISTEIIEELQKNGHNYHIFKHNYTCPYFSTSSNTPILHFSLHKNTVHREVISTISCMKFSKNYYLLIIFDNKDLKKRYRYDTVSLEKLAFINLSN